MPKPSQTILILDDEADIVETLKDILTESGYRVISASNGVDGLEILGTTNPDLIILDMNMPKMGGIAFFQNILDSKTQKPKYPILVLSARYNLEDIFKDYEVDFVPKPFHMDQLLHKVESLLNKEVFGPIPALTEASKNTLPLIYIVDHEASAAESLQKLLGAQFQILHSRSAEGVIKMAAAKVPHLILMRLELEGMSGEVAALKLKMMPKVTDSPILLYSSQKNTDNSFELSGRIYEKLGIRIMIEIDDLSSLAREACELFHKHQKAA